MTPMHVLQENISRSLRIAKFPMVDRGSSGVMATEPASRIRGLSNVVDANLAELLGWPYDQNGILRLNACWALSACV